MSDLRTMLERGVGGATPPPDGFERMLRRRDRKRRNQRVAAGAVGFAAFLAVVLMVTSVGSLNRSETPVVPGASGTAGPTETRGETGPARTGGETGPAETGPVAIGHVPKTDYLLDLDTGEMTPLPESIVGTADRIHDYAASPDGSKLAYAGPGGNGVSQIFIANLDGSGVEAVTTDDGVTTWSSPTWSPDGSKIALVGQLPDESPNIFILDLATGVSSQVTFETAMNGPWPPSFTPDGASIVYGTGREIWIVPIAGGEPAQLADPTGFADSVQLSPDDSLLAYSCPGGLIRICLANVDGTDARPVAGGPNSDSLVGPRWSPDGTRLAYWAFHAAEVFVVDVATGTEVHVTSGAYPAWLDDHTLIVKPDRCIGPITERCGG